MYYITLLISATMFHLQCILYLSDKSKCQICSIRSMSDTYSLESERSRSPFTAFQENENTWQNVNPNGGAVHNWLVNNTPATTIQGVHVGSDDATTLVDPVEDVEVVGFPIK